MTKLSVNLNKVALIRNSRGRNNPNILEFVKIAIDSGADGVTLHPRPDARHATEKDVDSIKNFLVNFPDIELNIEGNPFHNLLPIVKNIHPTQCTFVPDEIGAITSTKGWDLGKSAYKLSPEIIQLKKVGVRVSLFMNPLPLQIKLAKKCGADRIELYTEPFAKSINTSDCKDIIKNYKTSGAAATDCGLGINAGHDLNQENLGFFLESVKNVEEVSIGHALIVDSLRDGFSKTIAKYKKIIEGVK